jgi:hypothetical protein
LKGELTKEKKFEPTPEMKAKIDELIRKVEAQEVRELSADELDGVAGGPEYMRDTLRSRIIHMASGDFNPFSIWG